MVQPQRGAHHQIPVLPSAFKKLEDISSPIERAREREVRGEGGRGLNRRRFTRFRAMKGDYRRQTRASARRPNLNLPVRPGFNRFDEPDARAAHASKALARARIVHPSTRRVAGPPVSLYVTPLTDTHANLARELFRDSSLIFKLAIVFGSE